jgi:hypothetical protein
MTDTADDRARIEEAREDWGVDLVDCFCHGCSLRRDLLRMAEDGIAAREALARCEDLADEARACDAGESDRAWGGWVDADALDSAITGEAT